jgi:polyadenylate-binding protein
VTKVKIAKVIKDEAGVDIDIEPQIKRDIGRHFYTAMVKINDQESFKKVLEKLKYPVIEGKPCRALPFNPEFLGNQKAKLTEKNVFVRKIPKQFTCKDLDEKFSQYGQIMSVKISLNAEHESNQYGFVCFANPDSATAAISSTS